MSPCGELRNSMIARRVCEVLGFISGLVLIIYGFSFLASGLPGAHISTSQFVAFNLLVAGSIVVFTSVYFLLRPTPLSTTGTGQPVTAPPNVEVELISDAEDTSSHYGLYTNLKYIGYFFTALGIFAAADLTLQVFMRSLYNEIRWWIEILLVTFGVLSYAIFATIGRLGTQEEPKTTKPLSQAAAELVTATASPQQPETYRLYDNLRIDLAAFARSDSGELERKLVDNVYDMIRIEPRGVTIWREERRGFRTVYISGPYEIDWGRITEAIAENRELSVGLLHLSSQAMHDLLSHRGKAGGRTLRAVN